MTLYDVAAAINKDLERQSKMRIGDQITHPDGRTVVVVSGSYLRNGRVSNFWYWREVFEDGSLGKIESGYGW